MRRKLFQPIKKRQRVVNSVKRKHTRKERKKGSIKESQHSKKAKCLLIRICLGKILQIPTQNPAGNKKEGDSKTYRRRSDQWSCIFLLVPVSKPFQLLYFNERVLQNFGSCCFFFQSLYFFFSENYEFIFARGQTSLLKLEGK